MNTALNRNLAFADTVTGAVVQDGKSKPIFNLSKLKNTVRQLAHGLSIEYHRAHRSRLLCPQCETLERVIGCGKETELLTLACKHVRPSAYRLTDDIEALAVFAKQELI